MVSRFPLSQAQKEQIYLGKLAGRSLAELAGTVGCTVHCARKWWRVGRDRGLTGLRTARRGRGKARTLSCFDPVSGAMIASRAFAVGTQRRWRKLEWTEVREVVRAAFAEWRTLPDALQTDHELGLAGTPNDSFPGKLTLWLQGLGVSHRFIRPGRPTDQPHIERNHRTLKNWAVDSHSVADLHHLQQALERERQVHNHLFPCQASDCAGRPPLTAHQELLTPRRLYQLDREQELFDPQRVYDFLAQLRFKRRVDGKARVSLGRQTYSLGQQHVREHKLQSVLARFDPNAQEWVFLTPDEEEIVRRPSKGLDLQSLTGLNPLGSPPAQGIQLTLPFIDPQPGVRLVLDS